MQGPSQDSKLPTPVLLALLAQAAIAGGTHLAAKRATMDFGPVPLLAVRLVLAALAFAVLLPLMPPPRLPPRKTWLWLLGFGVIAGPVNQGLFLYGLSTSRATHAALLYALTPIGVYLVGLALKRERTSPRRLAGIAVAFAGVVVLLLGRGLSEAKGPLVGDLFILGAVAAWVVWTTESRRFSAEYGGVRTAAWSIIAAGLVMVPVAPFLVTRAGLEQVTAVGWGCLAWLVLLTSVVSYALWNYALARAEASQVAVFANLQPAATAIAAWLILGEPLVWEVWVGGGLVLAGVRLAQGGRRSLR